jgi:hypothetical protein
MDIKMKNKFWAVECWHEPSDDIKFFYFQNDPDDDQISKLFEEYLNDMYVDYFSEFTLEELQDDGQLGWEYSEEEFEDEKIEGEMITISISEYNDLIKDSNKLRCLETTKVGN